MFAPDLNRPGQVRTSPFVARRPILVISVNEDVDSLCARACRGCRRSGNLSLLKATATEANPAKPWSIERKRVEFWNQNSSRRCDHSQPKSNSGVRPFRGRCHRTILDLDLGDNGRSARWQTRRRLASAKVSQRKRNHRQMSTQWNGLLPAGCL